MDCQSPLMAGPEARIDAIIAFQFSATWPIIHLHPAATHGSAMRFICSTAAFGFLSRSEAMARVYPQIKDRHTQQHQWRGKYLQRCGKPT